MSAETQAALPAETDATCYCLSHPHAVSCPAATAPHPKAQRWREPTVEVLPAAVSQALLLGSAETHARLTDAFTEALAEAWDAGHRVGESAAHFPSSYPDSVTPVTPTPEWAQNPYRAAALGDRADEAVES